MEVLVNMDPWLSFYNILYQALLSFLPWKSNVRTQSAHRCHSLYTTSEDGLLLGRPFGDMENWEGKRSVSLMMLVN